MVISDKFILNEIEGKSKDVSLVTFDSEILIDTGISFSRNINAEDGYSQFNPMFNDEDIVPDDIILNFMYDKNGIPQEWTEWKILDIKKWIITDEFIPFVTFDNLDYIYYIKCKKIRNRMTPYGFGVLECTFTPLSHFAYQKIEFNMNVTELNNIIIQNPSMYKYKPIIKIKNLGDISTVNKVGSFEISGLNKNEVVVVDNLMLGVVNSNGDNRFSNCNRGWVELMQEENNLQLNGNCEVQISCEFPIVL